MCGSRGENILKGCGFKKACIHVFLSLLRSSELCRGKTWEITPSAKHLGTIEKNNYDIRLINKNSFYKNTKILFKFFSQS